MDTFFSIFLDRIDGIYRILIFSPAAIRPSAEGRFILTILLILSKDFEYGIESIHILFFRQDLQDFGDLISPAARHSYVGLYILIILLILSEKLIMWIIWILASIWVSKLLNLHNR